MGRLAIPLRAARNIDIEEMDFVVAGDSIAGGVVDERSGGYTPIRHRPDSAMVPATIHICSRLAVDAKKS